MRREGPGWETEDNITRDSAEYRRKLAEGWRVIDADRETGFVEMARARRRR
jgi:hypothetical protein